MTPEQTLDVLELLSGAFPDREITERMAATYALAWADADFDSMRVAAVAYIRSGERFFPAPGVLLESSRVELGAPSPRRPGGRCGPRSATWATPAFRSGATRESRRPPAQPSGRGRRSAARRCRRRWSRTGLGSLDAYRGIEAVRVGERRQAEARELLEAPTLNLPGLKDIGRLPG